MKKCEKIKILGVFWCLLKMQRYYSLIKNGNLIRHHIYFRASKFRKSHGDSDFSSGKWFAWYSVFWVFWAPRWPANAFPSVVLWTDQCVKAPHFLHYVPQNIHSSASLKKPTPLPVHLPVQISVTSNSTVLSSRFYHRFFFSSGHSGCHESYYKKVERKTVS